MPDTRYLASPCSTTLLLFCTDTFQPNRCEIQLSDLLGFVGRAWCFCCWECGVTWPPSWHRTKENCVPGPVDVLVLPWPVREQSEGEGGGLLGGAGVPERSPDIGGRWRPLGALTYKRLFGKWLVIVTGQSATAAEAEFRGPGTGFFSAEVENPDRVWLCVKRSNNCSHILQHH